MFNRAESLTQFRRRQSVLPYSSRTSAHPKEVKLSHYNLVVNVAQVSPVTGQPGRRHATCRTPNATPPAAQPCAPP